MHLHEFSKSLFIHFIIINTVIDNSQISGDLSLDLDLAYITYFFLCTTLEVKLIE